MKIFLIEIIFIWIILIIYIYLSCYQSIEATIISCESSHRGGNDRYSRYIIKYNIDDNKEIVTFNNNNHTSLVFYLPAIYRFSCGWCYTCEEYPRNSKVDLYHDLYGDIHKTDVLDEFILNYRSYPFIICRTLMYILNIWIICILFLNYRQWTMNDKTRLTTYIMIKRFYSLDQSYYLKKEVIENYYCNLLDLMFHYNQLLHREPALNDSYNQLLKFKILYNNFIHKEAKFKKSLIFISNDQFELQLKDLLDNINVLYNHAKARTN